jgi:hypothetical protein
MVEVGIVSTLREVVLRGPLHIECPQLLVVCAFILALGIVLRFAGINPPPIDSGGAYEKIPGGQRKEEAPYGNCLR